MKCLNEKRFGALVKQSEIDDSIKAHLASCSKCGQAWARVQYAQALLREMKTLEPPTPSAPRMEAQIRFALAAATQTREEKSPRWPWVAGMSLAMAALAVVVFVQLHRPPAKVVAQITPPAPKVIAAPVSLLSAVVTQLAGAVTLERNGVHAPLQFTDRLSQADKISIGKAHGRVSLQWAEGSGLLLTDGTVSFKTFVAKDQVLTLDEGHIDVRVGPHQPGESLKIETKGHIVSVKGTWFAVASTGPRSTVDVYEGLVEVTDRKTGVATMLHAPAHAVFDGGQARASNPSAQMLRKQRAQSELNLLAWPLSAGALKIDSTLGVTVAVDGLELGAQPLTVLRPLGQHLIELSRPGFVTLKQWVTVGDEPAEVRGALVVNPVRPIDEDALQKEIGQLVSSRSTQIRHCYERRLKALHELSGSVTLRLELGEAGQVRRAKVEESTIDDEQLEQCLKQETMGWNFKAGHSTTIIYPFVFRAD